MEALLCIFLQLVTRLDRCHRLNVLPNQVCLPDAQQAKCWDVKVCSRWGFIQEAVEWGDGRTDLKPASPSERGLGCFRDKQGSRRPGECLWQRWLETKKRWGSCRYALVHFSYMLLYRVHVEKILALAPSEGGVLGPLTSKGHRSCVPSGRVGGPSQSQLTRAWPGQQLTPSSWKTWANILRLLHQRCHLQGGRGVLWLI